MRNNGYNEKVEFCQIGGRLMLSLCGNNRSRKIFWYGAKWQELWWGNFFDKK